MKSTGSARLAALLALGGGLALATGVAFGAWLHHGAAIFLATAQAGLAWCF